MSDERIEIKIYGNSIGKIPLFRSLSSDDGYFLGDLSSPTSPSPINIIPEKIAPKIAIKPTISSITKEFLKLNFTFYVITGFILALIGIILLTLISTYPAIIVAAFSPAFSVIGIQILSGLLIALGGYLCFENNSNSWQATQEAIV